MERRAEDDEPGAPNRATKRPAESAVTARGRQAGRKAAAVCQGLQCSRFQAWWAISDSSPR